ncbi:MAG: 30S ribosomal protein S27e [Candidatus Aenigmarchaeota archaeon]|nr:30S ribosomal protein S27e [Candidatus Aenigmarchaeota archaeon]
MPGKFVTVKCEKCKNEQTVFEKPAQAVTCLVCHEVLMVPRGGKGEAKGKVIGTAK